MRVFWRHGPREGMRSEGGAGGCVDDYYIRRADIKMDEPLFTFICHLGFLPCPSLPSQIHRQVAPQLYPRDSSFRPLFAFSLESHQERRGCGATLAWHPHHSSAHL